MKKNRFNIGDDVVLIEKNPTFYGYDNLKIGNTYKILYITDDLIRLDIDELRGCLFMVDAFVSLEEYRESKLKLLLD